MPTTIHHLGWELPVLPAAAGWLAERFGDDLGGVLLVLPASRAGRRLTELLAERFDGRPWTPPEVTTLGGLPARLTEGAAGGNPMMLDALAAGWIRATCLRAADHATLEAVVPRPPGPDDWRGWLALARQLGRLDDELAGARLTNADVPARAAERAVDLGMSEARWAAIAALQQDYEAAHGDRHDEASALRAASDSAPLGPAAARPVVMIGLVDVPPAFAALLGRCDDVTVLSPVPAEHAAGLGPVGQLVTNYWEARAVVAPEPIVCDRPADQGAATARAAAAGLAMADAAGLAGGFDRLTVGLGDEQAAGPVRRALESAGGAVREAAGRPALASGPGQLLAALGRYADGRGVAALAELVRHPDLYPELEQTLDRLHPELAPGERHVARGIAGFDDQRRTHAAARVGGPLPERAYALDAARTRADALLPDAVSARKSWPDWSTDLLALLQNVYGDRSLSRRDDHDLIEALSALAAVLNEQVALGAADHAANDAALSLTQAIDLTLSRFAETRLPEAGGAGAAEMLGFLEVALDDAPALVLVDVNEGRIPAGRNTSDAFLPDGLRRALGLIDAASRYATDLVLMNVALRSRPYAAVLCCRRDTDGTPRMPSRLMLAADDDTVLRRVKAFYSEDAADEVAPDPETSNVIEPESPPAPSAFVLPHPAHDPPAALPDKLAVTAFRDYLACPYRFYLGRVLKLNQHDEPLPELDPGRFGDLAHAVMERFGHETALHDCTDAEPLADYFAQALHEEARRQFGRSAAPAVRVQVARLERRLQHAAVVQAARAAAGWRIVPAWTERSVERVLDADGHAVTVTSKVDRVDRHPELGVCVVDYKTSEAAKTPEKQHQKGSKKAGYEWTDLQLPLYRWLLAQPHDTEPLPDAAVGYFNLAKNPKLTGVFIANWTPADHADALTTARDVVRHLGARNFWPPGDPARFPDGFARLCADANPERDTLIARGTAAVTAANGGAA